MHGCVPVNRRIGDKWQDNDLICLCMYRIIFKPEKYKIVNVNQTCKRYTTTIIMSNMSFSNLYLVRSEKKKKRKKERKNSTFFFHSSLFIIEKEK